MVSRFSRRHLEILVGVCTVLGFAVAVLAYVRPTTAGTHDDVITGSPKASAKCQSAIDAGVTTSKNPIAIDLFAELRDHKCEWATDLSPVLAGNDFNILLQYKNQSSTIQRNVAVFLKLPTGLTAVPGTTRVINSNNPHGLHTTVDAFWSNGILIGSYAKGAVGYVLQRVRAAGSEPFKCGLNHESVEGSVQVKGLNYFFNTVDVGVLKRC